MKRLFWIALFGVLFAPAVARAQSDEVVYYHTDAIGSVRMITNPSGVDIARYDYTPFGQPWPPPDPMDPAPDVRQFAGKEHDDTGLDYFGARYYNSYVGRFTTVDPVTNVDAALGDPQRWNRYSYARNNPQVFIDPDGRDIVMRLWIDQQTLARNAAMRDKVANVMGAGAPGDNPVAALARTMVDAALGAFFPRNNNEVVDAANAQIMGIAAPMEIGAASAAKAVNLPAWKSVAIDMEHVLSGHTSEGVRAVQSGLKSIFPESMNPQQIERAIRNAYRFGEKLVRQGDVYKIRGPWGNATIEMWVNIKTKVIESAYPLF